MTPTPTHPVVQPCPFCGHATAPQLGTSADLDENWDDSNVPYHAVFCDASKPGGRGGCGASGGFAPTEAEAVERWNRRASLPAVQGEQPTHELWRIAIDYAIACGELSKGLPEDDPMWADLLSLGKRLDAVKAAATSSVAPGGLPLARADGQDGLVDPVVPTPEPPGATLSPAASQWISVDARLPDDPAQECLVYWGTSFGKPLYGIATLSTPWKGELLWHGHRGSHSDVTLWQPITPPTYQVEQGESSSKGGESNG